MNKYEIVFIEDEILDSYLNYAVSVIIGRALPDIRDGLKPVHRRTLFAMKELKNHFNKPYKKSARVVGDIIGKYHPHGEIAIYDSIVRLAQPFVLRYPLIDGQGNFGSIDGDSAAAMRYTEIRLSEFAEFMLSDLDFLTVDYIFNYDNTEKYPIILPSKLPNILLNGSCGIAVGVATNIPTHNITEVINGCIAFLDNPLMESEEFINYILGPDFPTFGIICESGGILNYYTTGKGQILIRSKVNFEYFNTKKKIIINELPYQVNKLKLIEKINLLIKEKKIFGINGIFDESDKNGIRISLDINNNYDENIILDNLYSLTQMQIIFNVNMIALVNNIPKLLNLKTIIESFIKHRKEILYRKIQFELNNIEKKTHLLEGFIIILYSFDKFIDIIKNLNNLVDLKIYLEKNIWYKKDFIELNIDILFKNSDIYCLSKIQIQSILDLKISNFLKIEKENIYKNYLDNNQIIINYKNILNSSDCISNLIKQELNFLKEKFGDKRRTVINYLNDNKQYFNSLYKENIFFILSKFGYINFLFVKNFQTQNDTFTIKIKNYDSINNVLFCKTYGFIFCISNLSKFYKLELSEIFLIDTTYSHKKKYIYNLLNIKKKEFIDKIFYLESFDINKLIICVTKIGLIKILSSDMFKICDKNGHVFDFLNDIVDIKLFSNLDEIILFSNLGRSIRFSLKNMKVNIKQLKNNLCIKMLKNEYIVSFDILKAKSYIISSTENGFIKKTRIEEYSLVKKGGKGVIGMKINKKTGKIINIVNVLDKSYLLFIYNNGKIIKMSIDNILQTSRVSSGVKLLKLVDNEMLHCVINF